MHERPLQNTIIILMGCDGPEKNDMAKAFIKKGAKLFISWNGPVMPEHTDKTTTHILLNLLAKKQTIENAVTETTLSQKNVTIQKLGDPSNTLLEATRMKSSPSKHFKIE